MSVIELLLISLGLSMDAFAVSICIGMTMTKAKVERALVVGLYFGIFQAVMPLIGYTIAAVFADKIVSFDHWIAFALLVFLGGKMIIGSLKNGRYSGIKWADKQADSLKPMQMLPLAIATSIDALAVGVSLAFLRGSIVLAVSFVGCVTFVTSIIGVRVGHIFGTKFKSKAELAGGIILVLIGFKILLEHVKL